MPSITAKEWQTASRASRADHSAARTPLSDPEEIDRVFRQFVDPVYRFIYRQLGNKQDAEDLTSEVFLRAARNLDTSRPEKAVGQWLFTVSRTVIADHWRRYYRMPPPVDIDNLQVAEGAGENEGSKPGLDSQRVHELLAKLSDRYRTVLELRFLRGYTLNETAQELGLSLENVKVIQHRALAKAVQIADESI